MLDKFVGKDFICDGLQLLRGDTSIEKIPTGAAYRLDVGYAKIPDPLQGRFLDRVHHAGIVRDLNGPADRLTLTVRSLPKGAYRPEGRATSGGLQVRGTPLV